MVALFIATVGLVSLHTMQVGAIKSNSASNARTKAIYLAQGMLERIKDGEFVAIDVFDYTDISASDSGAILDHGLMDGIDEHGNVGGPFSLHWQVSTNTGWSRRITVLVTWKSILGTTRQARLSTIFRGGGAFGGQAQTFFKEP